VIVVTFKARSALIVPSHVILPGGSCLNGASKSATESEMPATDPPHYNTNLWHFNI